jgi:hypothetical protein
VGTGAEDQGVEIERHARSLCARASVPNYGRGAAPRKGCAATPGPDSASDVGGGVVSAGALEGLVARATAPPRAWA